MMLRLVIIVKHSKYTIIMGRKTKSLFQFMSLTIKVLMDNGQYRTMQHYKATLKIFMRFRGNKDIAMCEINADEMQSFEAYLKNKAKVCCNTSSFYLRILRATYNKAVANGLTTQKYPFKNVYTGIAKTRKRAISTESVRQIKRLDSEKYLTSKQKLARDIFLMCFYLRGISFIDLAYLRKSDIKEGYISYVRSKTGQRLFIRWEKEMQEIVDKYQEQTANSPYLFPFLSRNYFKDNKAKNNNQYILHDIGDEERRLYRNAEACISYHLKKLGIKIGIKGRLTLYVARHSWATAARNNNIPISVISEALGHNSETTTQIYLRSIKSSEVDDANAKVLATI